MTGRRASDRQAVGPWGKVREEGGGCRERGRRACSSEGGIGGRESGKG